MQKKVRTRKDARPNLPTTKGGLSISKMSEFDKDLLQAMLIFGIGLAVLAVSVWAGSAWVASL